MRLMRKVFLRVAFIAVFLYLVVPSIECRDKSSIKFLNEAWDACFFKGRSIIIRASPSHFFILRKYKRKKDAPTLSVHL